jgi:hypothetical protein
LAAASPPEPAPSTSRSKRWAGLDTGELGISPLSVLQGLASAAFLRHCGKAAGAFPDL